MNKVVSTKRKGITHLQQMDPVKFVSWLRNNDSIGVATKLVMKIDGLGARFGKDPSSRPFFEGSKTGPIFNPGSFSEYSKSINPNSVPTQRAIHYDELFDLITDNKIMGVIPENSKVICEIFYTPMAIEETDNHITFVHIAYDKKKIGKLLTIMPYTVIEASTGNEHPNKTEILEKLYSLSDDEIKIINPNLIVNNDIDISKYSNDVKELSDQTLLFLKSRKHGIDREIRQSLLSLIQKTKDELSDYILYHPNIVDKYKLGENIEGVVIWIDGIEYKITTSEFKSLLKNERL